MNDSRLPFSTLALAAAVIALALWAPSLAAQEAAGRESGESKGAFQVLDSCCLDLDGEGPEDDGVLAITRDGHVIFALLYEDPDKNRTFDTADQILAVMHGAPPGMGGAGGVPEKP